jgi:hypothetical protein
MRFTVLAFLAVGCAARPLDLPLLVEPPSDLSMAAAPDLSAPADLGVAPPDLAPPDLSHADLALPDLLPPGGLLLALNSTHGCARVPGGQVECWGANDHGQLGDGTTVTRDAPSPIPSLSDVIDVAVGDGYSCALERGGRVSCWGANDRGQLGDGTTEERHSPAPITLDGAPVQLVGGELTACALFADGSASCWGANGIGEIGDGTCRQDRLAPGARVTGLRGSTQISAGYSELCARLADGTLRCWGNDIYLGLGVVPSTSPQIIADSQRCGWSCSAEPVEPAISSVVEVVMQNDYGCAVMSGGAVECWGFDISEVAGGQPANTYGQVPPVTVTLPAPAVHLAALEGGKVLALLADGRVMMWDVSGASNAPGELTGFEGLELLWTTTGVCGKNSDGTLTCVGAPSTFAPF